jgi:phage terminase large subunit GpA-like protein
MLKRKITNISERKLAGELLNLFMPPIRMSTIEWAKKYRNITNKETSFGIGQFDPNYTPYMEYVYECLDNPYIPIINSQKSARIAWTETLNNFRGKKIHTNPCSMLLGFATGTACKNFGKIKWKNFLDNVTVLRGIVNVGVAKNKQSFAEYEFPNGSLRLVTLGSISSQKSDNFPYIEIEEPDDAPNDVSNQGDTLANLKQRQKTVPLTLRKLIFGGTPTNKDFSRVEAAIKVSNMMTFKAECHECKELVAMDGPAFDNIVYSDFQDRKIDDQYGKSDPETAMFLCPCCKVHWTFEQKNLNIVAGKQFGFTDHTGNFSKGWHPKKPHVTDAFGFIFSELLSPFPQSNFIELTKLKILADLDKAKGKEGLMKSYFNNNRGEPYASGFSAMEVEDMVKLRSNYEQNVVPMEGLVLTMGIDVQHNRFALVILAWGINGNVWLVTWKEIFGNVHNSEDGVWEELTGICCTEIPHIMGKTLPISAVSIDSGDGGTVELVYRWVNMMNMKPEFNGSVRATKGVRDLKFSTDDVYKEPAIPDLVSYKQVRRSLAERMGVAVFILGAHRAHDEVLRRLSLNAIENCRHDVFYFNEQSYGDFEEQILSCRKLVDVTGNSQKEFYQLVSGKRKEAMDCCKNAFHANYASGIREFSDDKWKAIAKHLTGE